VGCLPPGLKGLKNLIHLGRPCRRRRLGMGRKWWTLGSRRYTRSWSPHRSQIRQAQVGRSHLSRAIQVAGVLDLVSRFV